MFFGRRFLLLWSFFCSAKDQIFTGSNKLSYQVLFTRVKTGIDINDTVMTTFSLEKG